MEFTKSITEIQKEIMLLKTALRQTVYERDNLKFLNDIRKTTIAVWRLNIRMQEERIRKLEEKIATLEFGRRN